MNAHPPEDEQGIEVEDIARLLPAPPVPELSDDRLRELRGSFREEIRIGRPRRRRRLIAVAVALGAVAAAVFATVSLGATAGKLDTSFGGDGRVVTDLTLRDDWASAVAIQADGKIVLAGGAGYTRFGVARYSSDGSLDTRFSGDGRAFVNFTSGEDSASGVAIQADGKIVAAGTSGVGGANTRFALARYSSDGTLDATFGGDGKVMTDFTAKADYANGVAVQPDAKIVVAGTSGVGGANTRFALARYNSDGTLDATFGGDGKVMTDLTAKWDAANGVAIQADGKIVVAGTSGVGGANTRFALARYNSDGTLDATFGGDGKVETGLWDQATASDVAIQADGKIVAAGEAAANRPHNIAAGLAAAKRLYSRFALARYNSDGTLDATFGGGGKVMTDFTAWGDGADAVAIQADGKMVVGGGSRSVGLNPRFALARYNSDGTLDASFGGDGKVETDFTPRRDGASCVAIQADGKIVAAGWANSGRSKMKVALARYLAQ